jgi:hypothetical protein
MRVTGVGVLSSVPWLLLSATNCLVFVWPALHGLRSRDNRGQRRLVVAHSAFGNSSAMTDQPATRENPAPLYITIGPPCSGKTTWLRQRQGAVVRDICLDDQPGVYRPLDSCYFWNEDSTNDAILQESVVNETLAQRLRAADQAELRCLCAYVAGKLSRGDLQLVLEQQQQQQQQQRQQSSPRNLVPTILTALDVHQRDHTDLVLPGTVDLFCRQVLFTRIDNVSAIDAAMEALRQTPVSQSVAWGNTNLRASDYAIPLQIASDQGRPVRFVIFDGRSDDEANNILTFAGDAFDLPAADLDELMLRNIKRWLQTGRYIPVAVLADMLHRSHESLEAMTQWDEKAIFSKHDVQRHFANALQFDMQLNGTVVFAGRKRPRPVQDGGRGTPQRTFQRGPPTTTRQYTQWDNASSRDTRANCRQHVPRDGDQRNRAGDRWHDPRGGNEQRLEHNRRNNHRSCPAPQGGQEWGITRPASGARYGQNGSRRGPFEGSSSGFGSRQDSDVRDHRGNGINRSQGPPNRNGPGDNEPRQRGEQWRRR